MTEAAYQQRLKKRLEREGALVIKYHASGYGVTGVPDLYVASKAFTGWLEVKVGRNRPTPKQTRMMRSLLLQGVPAMIVRGPDGVNVELPDGTPAADLVEHEPLLPQLAGQEALMEVWAWSKS